MNRRCAQRRESALGRQEDLLPVAATKVVILGTAPAEFTDSFHPQIQAIEAMREWAFDRYRVARRTSSEKPRLRISSPPDRSVPAAVSADEFGARSSGSLPPSPASLFLFAVTVLEPPLRSRNIARFGEHARQFEGSRLRPSGNLICYVEKNPHH
jgi:hypothetical protein